MVAINFKICELNNNKNNNSVNLIERLPTPLGYHRQPITCVINTKKIQKTNNKSSRITQRKIYHPVKSVPTKSLKKTGMYY
jgi:hypothetical protein